MGLDVADDHVGAALLAPLALVEHGERLADARRGAEVDAQRAPRSRPAHGDGHQPSCRPTDSRCAQPASIGATSSRARLSSSTLTPGSPRMPSGRSCVWSSTRRSTSSSRGPARRGDAGRLEAGVAHRDLRVEAGARRGHGVDGHQRVGAEAVLVAVGGDPLGDRGEEVGVGRAEVGAARRAGVVARRRRPTGGGGSTAGDVNGWPISADPTTAPSRSISEPLAVSPTADLGDRRSRRAGRRGRRRR